MAKTALELFRHMLPLQCVIGVLGGVEETLREGLDMRVYSIEDTE